MWTTGAKTRLSGFLAAKFAGCALLLPGFVLAGPAPPNADCQAALNAVVTEFSQLNFGSVLAGTAGTVTITYQDSRSTNGPTLLGSTFSRAVMIFTTDVPPTGPLDCSKNTPTITLTGGQLNRVGGYTGVPTPLTLNNMVWSSKPTTPGNKFETGYIYIGGDLVIPAAPESGNYTGNYIIDLVFQ